MAFAPPLAYAYKHSYHLSWRRVIPKNSVEEIGPEEIVLFYVVFGFMCKHCLRLVLFWNVAVLYFPVFMLSMRILKSPLSVKMRKHALYKKKLNVFRSAYSAQEICFMRSQWSSTHCTEMKFSIANLFTFTKEINIWKLNSLFNDSYFLS